MTRYQNEQAAQVKQEMQDEVFGDLDLERAGHRAVPFGTQLKLIRGRSILFVKREPQAVLAKIG